jgi:hypothetical protein
MKYLIPVFVGGAAITAAITTALAHSLTLHLCGYGAAVVLLVIASVLAVNAHREERKKDAAPPSPYLPRVRPVVYGGEGSRCGLTIANPGYDASDVHIPPVPVAESGYTLIFPERVALLTERDHHHLIVARLEHPPQPPLDGEHLLAAMRSANVKSLKFAIIYRDDSGGYKSNCAIEQDANARGGLAVRFLNQEVLSERGPCDRVAG